MSDPNTNRPTETLQGIHHVTAIAGDAGTNVDFYTRVLGQRLVKKTVNFDDPGTYHLYYGDGAGTPGSIMTFFPWPGARRGTVGAGQASVTQYAIPVGSASWWSARLEALGVSVTSKTVFGEKVLELLDPDDLRLELVETKGVEGLDGWPGAADEPVEPIHAVRGFRGVTISTRRGASTDDFLRDVMGMEEVALEDGGPSSGPATDERIRRFRFPDAGPLGSTIDLLAGEGPGSGGAGTVHHVAFRIADDDAELRWQSFLARQGLQVSPVMDRQYFHSIYFREPGGVLFEIATDPPGFAIDEQLEALGEELKLPPGLEDRRAAIEAALPTLETAE